MSALVVVLCGLGIVLVAMVGSCIYYALRRLRQHDTPRDRRWRALRDLVVLLQAVDNQTLVSIKEMANGHGGLIAFSMMGVPGDAVVKIVDAVLATRYLGLPKDSWEAEIARRIGNVYDRH